MANFIQRIFKRFRSSKTGKLIKPEVALANKDESQLETFVYGKNKTIHQTGELNVELFEGKVVAVWFRCLHLPFDQSEATAQRAEEMNRLYSEPPPALVAVEIVQPKERK